jgi:hypothetical protein
LNPEFSHVRMPGSRNTGAIRKRKMRTFVFEQSHNDGDRVLLVFGQAVPPLLKLIRVFDFPVHAE